MDVSVSENSEEVVIMDNSGNVYRFEKVDDTEAYEADNLVYDNHTKQVKKKLVEETDYRILEAENPDYPVTFNCWIHLEDIVRPKFYRKIKNNSVEEFNRINLPSIEIKTKWEVDKNGKASLIKVDYNNIKYTR